MNPLFSYFAKRIIIDLSPSRFTFSIKEKDINISFSPFLYLEKGEAMWIPIAIGEEIPSEQRAGPNIYRIDINEIESESPSKPMLSSEGFLQLLFDYGIGRCFERFWFPQLRPMVFILSANRFSKQLKHPRAAFEIAAKRGGARVVIFDRTEL